MRTNLRLIFSVTASVLLSTFANVGAASAVAPDFDIDGVPIAGFPHFEDTVKVSFKKMGGRDDDGDRNGRTGWRLTAMQHGDTHLFQSTTDSNHDVAVPKFSLEADFDEDLNFIKGDMKLSGKIPGLGVRKQTLWEADLSDFGFNTGADGHPRSLGWKIINIEDDSWAVEAGYSDGITPESVYLYNFSSSMLVDMFAAGEGFKINRIDATALTTVPLPAAVWLLGAGLLALTGLRRRSEISSDADNTLLNI
ncbi:MAG: VPLPA-CTERM sorting domain-containing protein [Pseudomonadota bacterium]